MNILVSIFLGYCCNLYCCATRTMIFFPSKIISAWLWNQHYFRFFRVGMFILFGVLWGFFRLVFPFSRTLEMQKLHPKPFRCWALGKQTGKGMLWQEYEENAFCRLILRRLSHLRVNSCIICEKDLIWKYDIVIWKTMLTEFVK